MLQLKKVQTELYELMKEVHAFCVSNGIDYSLTGGSLLGAIRHNGFIPWDDDLDIMLTRENFEKFRSCYNELGLERYIFERDQWVYRVRKTHRTSGYMPSIDFFIIDKVPTNIAINKIQVIFLKILQGLLRTNEKRNSYTPIYRTLITISGWIGKAINNEWLFKLYDRISQWGNLSDGDMVSIFNDRFKLVGLKYANNLTEKYEDHAFENAEFRIIQAYDNYLTKQFGDYMKLPPEKDRVPQHIF